MYNIITHPTPELRFPSKNVTKFDKSLRNLVKDMWQTMRRFQGIGLSAVQVGIPLQVAVICVDYQTEYELVNPFVVKATQLYKVNEGCLSVPFYQNEISRHYFVTIEYQDIRGKQHTLSAQGLLAQAVQHELDHMHGTLFIDHFNELDKLIFEKRYLNRN